MQGQTFEEIKLFSLHQPNPIKIDGFFPYKISKFFLQFSVHLISKLLQHTIFLVFQSYLYLCKQVQDLVLQISNWIPGDSDFGFRAFELEMPFIS